MLGESSSSSLDLVENLHTHEVLLDYFKWCEFEDEFVNLFENGEELFTNHYKSILQ